MDASFKAKWIAALRSGRYRQTTGNLREKCSTRKYSYCCLGVLCHVAGAKWKDGSRPVIGETIMEASGAAYLSDDALNLVGLADSIQRELAAKNDDGYSFKEIADYIENNIKPLSHSPQASEND